MELAYTKTKEQHKEITICFARKQKGEMVFQTWKFQTELPEVSNLQKG
jgi:hypothetical protein